MIIECPNCGTKYNVREEAIKPRGRVVRCTSCGQQWHADGSPPTVLNEVPLVEDDPNAFAAVIQNADSDTGLEPTENEEDVAEGELTAHTVLSEQADELFIVAVAPPQLQPDHESSRKQKLASFALLAASVILLVAGVGVTRRPLTKLWPATDRLYRAVGMVDEVAGQGLELHNVHALLDTSPKGSGLTIQADVVNTSEGPRKVPLLKASVIQGSNPDKVFTFNSGVTTLPPQGTVAVKTSFEAAGMSDGKILLTFSPDNRSD